MNRFYDLALKRANLPRLTISQRVIDKIVHNSLIYETETGEALVGLVVPVAGRTEPDLWVLETVPPDDSAIRSGAYFEQGDDYQGDALGWYVVNWDVYRERRRGSYGNAIGAKWDVPLRTVGDWHKHPGTLTQPSGGDFDTAFEHVFDDKQGIPQLLVVLATVWDRAAAEADTRVDPDALAGTRENHSDEPRPLKIALNDTTTVRIDFWYMSRHTRRFVMLAPIVAEEALLPVMPPIPWYLSDPERIAKELAGLQVDGYSPNVRIFDADKVPPMEVCLPLFRMDSKHIYIVVTEPHYPAERPVIRYAPMSVIKTIPDGADVFAEIFKQTEPLPPEAYPSEAWTPEQTIAQLVRHVEAYFLQKEKS